MNWQIRVPRVLVIDDQGNKIGIMLTKDAINLAEERGLDLVEVGESADPPVTKLMDYGKFVYQKHKQEKDARKKTSSQKPIKEIKLGIKTDEHDLQTKFRHIREFMEKGSKTKLIVMFRGREMAHPELGRELMQRVIQELADFGAPDYFPKQEGRNLVAVISPHSKQLIEKIQKQKELEKQNPGSAPARQPVPTVAAKPAPKPAVTKEEEKVGQK